MPNFEGSRPRRLDIHSEISLATEYRLSYPGPFVKRKMRAARHWAEAPPSSRQFLRGELPAGGGGQVPTRRQTVKWVAGLCPTSPRNVTTVVVFSRAMDWKNKLYFGDNPNSLRDNVADASIDPIYLDPPFNSSAITTCSSRKGAARNPPRK